MSVNNIGPTGPQNVRVGDGSGVESKTAARADSSTAAGVDAGKSGTEDRVSITSTATFLQQVEEQLSKLPDVDDKRVEAIKQAIENGTFEIDANRVAEKLIAFDTALTKRDV